MRLIVLLLALAAPLLAPVSALLAPRKVIHKAFDALASWYGPGFEGRHTASGVIFWSRLRIIAHKTLPFGTKVQVRWHGRRVVGLVLDRGPFVRGRSFDLSMSMADRLGVTKLGKAVLEFRVLGTVPRDEWEAAVAP
jgi:rare lipoprotein A